MRDPDRSLSITGRPKSIGRHVIDAVLFLGVALWLAGSAVEGVRGGAVSLRSAGDVDRASNPTLFWGLLCASVLVAAACLLLSALAARGVMRGLREARS